MTMTEKICPVCHRSNLPTAKKCWYCQSLLDVEPVEEEAAEPLQPTQETQPAGGEQVPEWLARIRQRKAIEEMEAARHVAEEQTSSEPEPPAANASSSAEAETGQPAVPSWVEGLEEGTSARGETKSLQLPEEGEWEKPDWIEKLDRWRAREEEEDETPPAEKPKPESQSTAGEDTEEWLAEFLSSPINQEVPSLPETPEVSAGEKVPPPGKQSLADLKKAETPTPDEETRTPPVTDMESGEISSVLEAGFIPLADHRPPSPATEPPDVVKEVTHSNGSDLDWLEGYRDSIQEEPSGRASEELGGPSVSPFWGIQKSDWISLPVEPEGKKTAEYEPAEPEIESQSDEMKMVQPAQPVSPAPVGPIHQPEITGSEDPLAGITGTLESTGLPDVYGKPPIYTNKVQVTDRQNLRADLLTHLLTETASEQAPAAQAKPARRAWVKVFVSALLLAFVFLPLRFTPGTSLLPVLYPPEAVSAYSLINSLPVEKPVLVAADFEAGLSGEISFTAQSVLEHLMLRNSPMAVLSTNPIGSTLLDQMLAQSQQVVSAYDLTNNVVRFGYLAGGSVGIQSLVANIRTTLPFTANLMDAWNTPSLQKVNNLSDFSALVIITDDADSGRYWVEQVQPFLNGIPLILVTSAQAAPMLQPYYGSDQISGLVAGVNGGSAYEQIMQLPGNSSYFFGAYQVVILVIVVILLIGGLVSYFYRGQA